MVAPEVMEARAAYAASRREKAAKKRRGPGRGILRIGSWNVNGFEQRKDAVASVISEEKLDCLFLCETHQERGRGGTVLPLSFCGQIISTPAIESRSTKGVWRMGVAFLSKERESLKRLAIFKRGRWQLIVIEVDGIRCIGLYASPEATPEDWVEILVHVKCHRRGRTVLCGDFSASHPSWGERCSNHAGNVVQEILLDPLQRNVKRESHERRASRREDPEVGRQQRGPLYVLRAPDMPTNCHWKESGEIGASTYNLFMVSSLWKAELPERPRVLCSAVACEADNLPLVLHIDRRAMPRSRPRVRKEISDSLLLV